MKLIKILVIDDQLTERRLAYQSLFEGSDFDCSYAKTADEIEPLIAQEIWDLFVVDVVLDMFGEGWELSKVLGLIGNKAPVALISSHFKTLGASKSPKEVKIVEYLTWKDIYKGVGKIDDNEKAAFQFRLMNEYERHYVNNNLVPPSQRNFYRGLDGWNFKLERLEAVNFKCFDQKNVRFVPCKNLLLGINGSGKTVLLRAIRLALVRYLSGLGFNKALGGRPHDFPMTNQVGDEKLEIEFSKDPVSLNLSLSLSNLRKSQSEELSPENAPQENGVGNAKDQTAFKIIELSTKLEKNEDDGVEDVSDANQTIASIAKWIASAVTRKNEKELVLPVLGYYGCNRFKREEITEEIPELPPGSRFQAYKGCLEEVHRQTDLLSFCKDIALYSAQEKSKDPGFESVRLKAVVEALKSAFPNFHDLYFSLKYGKLVFEETVGQGNEIQAKFFSELSDGYRAVIGLIADIARRAVILNQRLGMRAAKDSPGIVLIDEIDLHLHPDWQKQIFGGLGKAFPNMQFIATTHSPYVIQSLDFHQDKVIFLDEDIEDPRKKLPEYLLNQLSISEISKRYMNTDGDRNNDFTQKVKKYLQTYYKSLKPNGSVPSIEEVVEACENLVTDSPETTARMRLETDFLKSHLEIWQEKYENH